MPIYIKNIINLLVGVADFDNYIEWKQILDIELQVCNLYTDFLL